MKKITLAFFATAALAVVGCQKQEVKETAPATITLNGIYNESLQAVKSDYEKVGDTYNFKWVSGDKFIAQSYNGVDYNSPTLFTASAGDAAQVPFTGTPASGYELSTYAFYPNAGDGATSYTNNFVYKNVAITPIAVNADVSAETATVALAGTITENIDHPMANIPMIGVKDLNGDYQFTACTGVLMITLANLPTTVNKICLDRISGDYPLNGSFVFDTSYEIKSRYCIGTPWEVKYMNISAGTDANSDGITDSPRSFYFPLPTGTIPANSLRLSVYNGSTIWDLGVASMDITITKGVVTELPAMTYVEEPSATVTGAYNARTANFTYNDAAEIKYAISTSSTARLSTLTPSTTSETSVSLAPASTGTYYLVYQGYKSDGTTKVGCEKRIQFLYVSNNVNDIIGIYGINNSADYKLTLAAVDPVEEGKNIQITTYYSASASYNGMTGNCKGIFDPATGTITIPSCQVLTKGTTSYYLVSTDEANFSSTAWTVYKSNFVLTLQPVSNNTSLRFNTDRFSIATQINTGETKFLSGAGQHWSNGTPYLQKNN